MKMNIMTLAHKLTLENLEREYLAAENCCAYFIERLEALENGDITLSPEGQARLVTEHAQAQNAAKSALNRLLTLQNAPALLTSCPLAGQTGKILDIAA